jgi:molybdopterin converting factor subunit 1
LPIVTVRFFAVARDQLGGLEREERELPVETDEGAIKAAIASDHPVLARLLACSRLAHNHQFIRGSVRLAAGDELAVIPPVSGG